MKLKIPATFSKVNKNFEFETSKATTTTVNIWKIKKKNYLQHNNFISLKESLSEELKNEIKTETETTLVQKNIVKSTSVWKRNEKSTTTTTTPSTI